MRCCVERIHDHHYDRGVEKCIECGCHEPEPERASPHRMDSSPLWDDARAYNHNPIMTTPMPRKAIAEPNGQSRLAPNCWAMALPSICVLPPPSRSGITNWPVAGTKTRIVPATKP